METKIDKLIEQAVAARHKAYAPYSHFKVGAALLTNDGAIFSGCNVENASYGLCICAERNVVCQAIAHGQRDFFAIVVAATPWAAPCGACRQFLVEFGQDFQVISVDANDLSSRKTWKIGELIPENFSLDQPGRKNDD